MKKCIIKEVGLRFGDYIDLGKFGKYRLVPYTIKEPIMYDTTFPGFLKMHILAKGIRNSSTWSLIQITAERDLFDEPGLKNVWCVTSSFDWNHKAVYPDNYRTAMIVLGRGIN